ncbi:MAG: hypothetical protein LBS86_00175 [Treponema sp.]|nr:hypothetical protein [Treponema sp.]
MNTRKLPVSIQDFQDLREPNLVKISAVFDPNTKTDWRVVAHEPLFC